MGKEKITGATKKHEKMKIFFFVDSSFYFLG